MATPKTQCSCVEEAERAWRRIESTVEISLDVIIIASAQTIDFSLQSQNCPSHNFSSATEVNDTFMQIYAKLVYFLERAMTTYTGAMPLPDTHKLALNKAGEQNSLWPQDLRSLESAVQKLDPVDRFLQQKQTPPVGVVCIPSKMALGEHELDEQQSKYLALDIICRTLRNMASVLQQMGGRKSAEIKKVDARLLAILLQVTRLVENASASLYILNSQIS